MIKTHRPVVKLKSSNRLTSENKNNSNKLLTSINQLKSNNPRYSNMQINSTLHGSDQLDKEKHLDS